MRNNFLLVEDNSQQAVLFSRYLKRNFNCRVDHAETAEQGLSLLTQNKYDAVVLDYMLHGMYGIDCLKTIKHQKIDVAIVFATGVGDENIAKEALTLGATDYISKSSITEQKFVEAINTSLKKYQKKKELKQKREELRLFAHTISHDLGSVLGRISSYSRLMKLLIDKLGDECENTNELKKYAQNIYEDVSFSVHFIKNLLKFAEIGRSKRHLEEVDLNQVARRAIKNLEVQIKNTGAQIIIPDLPKINGDKISLVQLLQNLISNSIKYCTKQPIIKYSVHESDNTLIIIHKDNGIGMKQDDLDSKIFQPFTRLENSLGKEGLGLGLAMCLMIIENHSGTITVESEIGNGSKFLIKIPKPDHKQ